MKRRAVITLLGGAAAWPVAARAQQPITLVVPFAPGGGMDALARALAERLRERLRQPVVVENRVGAGGMVKFDYVAKSAPNGSTLLLMDVSAVLHKWLHKSGSFDVIEDFAPVAQVATTPLVLFARPSLPVADVSELIVFAKANPGSLSVGSPGIGTPHHLAAVMLNGAAKIDITHVPNSGRNFARHCRDALYIAVQLRTPMPLSPRYLCARRGGEPYETPRFHHAARRGCRMAARGARAAGRRCRWSDFSTLNHLTSYGLFRNGRWR